MDQTLIQVFLHMGEVDRVWRIASTIFDKRKYQILKGLVEGKSASRVAAELGLTRGGIQHHLDALKELGLIDEELKPTPLGEDMVKLVEETVARISELINRHSSKIIERAVQQLASILASVGISVDTETIKKMIEEARMRTSGNQSEER